jgi:hypothetical protein
LKDTVTVFCPVLPPLSVTRQRQIEVYVALMVVSTLRDHLVLLDVGLTTLVCVSPETHCHE